MKTLRSDIAQVIAKKSLDSVNIKNLSISTAAYLLDNNRVNELEPLLRDIQAIWADRGYVEVTAVSAHKLTEQVRSDITMQVKRLYPELKHVVITEHIDSSIIGGVMLELPHQQLDLSFESRLSKFRQLASSEKGVEIS